jgi:hypothetical protein
VIEIDSTAAANAHPGRAMEEILTPQALLPLDASSCDRQAARVLVDG